MHVSYNGDSKKVLQLINNFPFSYLYLSPLIFSSYFGPRGSRSTHSPDRWPPVKQDRPPRLRHRVPPSENAKKRGRAGVRGLADRRAATDPISELYQREDERNQGRTGYHKQRKQCNGER